MRRRRRAVGRLVLVLSLCAACGHPPPSLTPVGAEAYRLRQVVQVLSLTQGAAIGAADANLISTTDARHVVAFTVEGARIASAAPDGWRALLAAGLGALQRQLPPAVWDRLKPYFSLVASLLEAN